MVWHVSTTEPGYRGKATVWAVTADTSGGTRAPGLLVADTLGQLRAMLPAGLTRRDRASVHAPDVLETWD